MKLDRNLNVNGMGKYALLKLRRLEEMRSGTFGDLHPSVAGAIKLLESAGLIDWGDTPETEFFVMRLKDMFSQAGLVGYGAAASSVDHEYAEEIEGLAKRAGPSHPNCKRPD
jgi:hypothetical protein